MSAGRISDIHIIIVHFKWMAFVSQSYLHTRWPSLWLCVWLLQRMVSIYGAPRKPFRQRRSETGSPFLSCMWILIWYALWKGWTNDWQRLVHLADKYLSSKCSISIQSGRVWMRKTRRQCVIWFTNNAFRLPLNVCLIVFYVSVRFTLSKPIGMKPTIGRAMANCL